MLTSAIGWNVAMRIGRQSHAFYSWGGGGIVSPLEGAATGQATPGARKQL